MIMWTVQHTTGNAVSLWGALQIDCTYFNHQLGLTERSSSKEQHANCRSSCTKTCWEWLYRIDRSSMSVAGESRG